MVGAWQGHVGGVWAVSHDCLDACIHTRVVIIIGAGHTVAIEKSDVTG